MKYLFLLLLISITVMLSGQEKFQENMPKEILECIDRMGENLSDSLNSCECKYLNYYFENTRGTFSFCGKKVGFLSGNIGTIIRNKKEYFETIQYILKSGEIPSHNMQQLIILDEKEIKIVGYNAVIVTGSKNYLTKKDIIRRLK